MQVMRIKKNISQGIISWPNTKFSEVTSQELCGRQLEDEIVEVKRLILW